MTLLQPDEIQAGLSALPGWSGDTAGLRREYRFVDFAAAIEAVGRIAEVAEAMNHHPDIDIRWNTVSLTVATHSEGGVTAGDLELAGRISAVADADH